MQNERELDSPPIIHVELTREVICAPKVNLTKETGASVEFTGIVRETEGSEKIKGLNYEAYESMALKTMRRLLEEICEDHPFQSAAVIHRVCDVDIGESAIYVRVTSAHRKEAFAACQLFMDRLKQDVPIWKVKSY